jgi:hypothetical protein
MASRASKGARAQAKSAGKGLKAIIKDVAESARAVAREHGAKRSVTIIKGQTVSKDQPSRIRIIKD